VVSLASSEDAEDEVVERRPGTEEEASLDGAAGDEDESSRGGDVAKSSRHTSKERKKSLSSLIRSSPIRDKPCRAGLQEASSEAVSDLTEEASVRAVRAVGA
jgi:hypothetical protein